MKTQRLRSPEAATKAREAALVRLRGRILGFLAITEDLLNAAAELRDVPPAGVKKALLHLGQAIRALTGDAGE